MTESKFNGKANLSLLSNVFFHERYKSFMQFLVGLFSTKFGSYLDEEQLDLLGDLLGYSTIEDTIISERQLYLFVLLQQNLFYSADQCMRLAQYNYWRG